jgi:hypothetical protein
MELRLNRQGCQERQEEKMKTEGATKITQIAPMKSLFIGVICVIFVLLVLAAPRLAFLAPLAVQSVFHEPELFRGPVFVR